VSTLAALLAGVFVFKGLPSPVDAFFSPRILIYAAPTRRPAPASQTFILIYRHFARHRRKFGIHSRVFGKRIGPIWGTWVRASALSCAKVIRARRTAPQSSLQFLK
jgi:hypothetical protein